MKKYFTIVFLLVLFLYQGKCSAYRPFITEDAGVAGKGVFQTEISWDYLKWGNKDKENIFLLVPIYGITQRTEISLEIPYLFHDFEKKHNGIGDANIVGKLLIFEEKSNFPAIALKGVIKSKTGDIKKGLGTDNLDYSIIPIASKALGNFTFHAMLGYNFIGKAEGENLRDTYVYGIGLNYKFTQKLNIVTEISGNRHPDIDSDNDPLSALLGFAYKISERAIIDSGIRYGINEESPKWNFLTGLSITL